MPRPGDRVGRYKLLAPLGSGGMGVVFDAIDPELDRHVALKLIHHTPKTGSDGRERLIREARALARLAHPNVVEVFDVGVHRGQVFVAMELVDGHTLATWVHEAERGERAIVDVFVQAARGLSAAHRAGLVHRDFKPSNVLVDRQGRVRVLDFGLARGPGTIASSEEPRSGEPDPALTHEISSLNTQLTQPGIVVGTPMYMAPEQHVGKPVDARTDQYSFCVALWESLYGARPFEGRTLRELTDNKMRRNVRVPAGRRVSNRLERVLLRGLDPEPDRRFASMDELVHAVVHRRRRSRVIAIAAVAVAAGAGAGLLWAGAEPAPCTTASARVDAVWSASRRAELEAAFLATESPLASSAWRRVGPAFDDRARRWSELHTEVCRATHVDGAQSDAELDRRMKCLDDRLAELDTYAGVLADATADDVSRAANMVARLEPLDACLDATELPTPADPSAAIEAAEIRRILVVVDALVRAARLDVAAERAAVAHARADRLAWEPVSLEVDVRLARLDELAGDYDAAARRLEQVAFAASARGYDQVAAQAKIAMVVVTGYHLARWEDAERWARDAESHLERLDDPGMTKAILLNGLGQAAERAGRFDDARRHQQASLELREQLLPPDHPDIGTARLNLGNAFYNAHDLAQAWDAYAGALAIWEASLGADHPDVGMLHNNMASVALDRQDENAAREHIERALAIAEGSHGDDHPDVAIVMFNYADLLARSDPGAAMERYRRALAIFERANGPEHPSVAACTSALGLLLVEAERFAEAEPLLRRSVEIVESAFGADHRELATPLLGLGIALSEQGRQGGAEHIERAVALLERGPADPLELAEARQALARALEREGDHERGDASD